MKRSNYDPKVVHRWKAPDGLDRMRPRPAKLTGGGKALLIVVVLLLTASAVAGISLTVISARGSERRRQLIAQGVETEARVATLTSSSGEKPKHWVGYRFSVHGRFYDGMESAPRRIWTGLRVGSTLRVRYVPSNPQINHPTEWQEKTLDPWVSWVASTALAAGSILALLPILSQRRLVVEGRAAPGLVTRHKKSKHGQIYHYEFVLLSGALATGRSGETKHPPMVGSFICVLYDAENPRKNAPYPLSLVKPALPQSL